MLIAKTLRFMQRFKVSCLSKRVFKQGNSSNNQKMNVCYFSTNFTVKYEVVLGLTQKDALSQRFQIMTSGKNVIFSAKLY